MTTPAGRARASELLALSNKALDHLAELLGDHSLVPLGVHLLPLRGQSLVCEVDVAMLHIRVRVVEDHERLVRISK